MPAMAESTGMGAAASMSSDKGDMGSNVKVVGLFGMGLTLMLMGLSFLPSPYGNGFGGWGSFWAALPVAGVFGGLVLLIVGLIALWKGHVYWGSAFASFGAFFIIWTQTINSPSALVQYYGLAGITFVFLLMTLTFLISSMKHGWVTFFLFLFFFISTILWLVVEWMTAAGNNISSGQWWATAAITFITGLIAWYAATAHLTNWTYGRKVLPG